MMVIQIKGIWVKVLGLGLVEVEGYVVDRKEKTCSCQDYKHGEKCKHIRFVEENEWQVEIEEKVWKANKEFEEWRKQQAPALTALKLMHTLKSY